MHWILRGGKYALFDTPLVIQFTEPPFLPVHNEMVGHSADKRVER